MAALKPCPRCRRLIPCGMTYCPTCKPLADAELQAHRDRAVEQRRQLYSKRYNAQRDPKYQTFYRSKAWRQTSKAKLTSVGYQCEARLEGCQGVACEVHHVVPIQKPDGWDRRLDWENLEAVCTSCHNGRHPEKLRKRDDGVIDLKNLKL